MDFTKARRAVKKVGFTIKKHGPEILMVAGAVGVVVSGVMACKATLKVEKEVLEPTKKNIDIIHEATEAGITEAGEVYTKEDSIKELTSTYTRAAIGFTKLYWKPVTLGTVSLGCMLYSHKIMKGRNLALASAAAALAQDFKGYRSRVIERFGERIDHELKYNVRAQEVDVEVVNEDGSIGKVTKVVDVANENKFGYGPYCMLFDESNPNWQPDSYYNKSFLISQEIYANKLLRTNGYLYLNDICKLLGLPKTLLGQTHGWIYDPNGGENQISFGMMDNITEAKRDFINGFEQSIWLDFNCQGDILSITPWKMIG